MAAKKHDGNKLKKRKRNPDVKNRTDSSASKKPKLVSSDTQTERLKKPFKPSKKAHNPSKLIKSESGKEKHAPQTNRERRLHAKVYFG